MKVSIAPHCKEPLKGLVAIIECWALTRMMGIGWSQGSCTFRNTAIESKVPSRYLKRLDLIDILGNQDLDSATSDAYKESGASTLGTTNPQIRSIPILSRGIELGSTAPSSLRWRLLWRVLGPIASIEGGERVLPGWSW